MNRLFIISILLCLVSSCREAEENSSPEDLAKSDSLALHVAVFPTLETLPLYYAERSGMMQEADADIRLLHYDSMTDADTAITRGHAQATFTDEARLLTLEQEKGMLATPIASVPATLALFSHKEGKINRIEQLKEKLIGMERHSHSDYWSDEILKGTDLTQLDIFHVQIGSTSLRYNMMMNQLIDAAFLPEPYASLCDTALAYTLWKQPEDANHWTVIAVPTSQHTDSLRSKQSQALLDLYEKARRRIIARPDTALLHRIYREDYHIQERDLKRTHWYDWQPAPLDSCSSLSSQEARTWLIGRGKLK